MSGGFAAFLDKELMEIRRTWRIWVLPAILLFVGFTSPILAELTPVLLKSVAEGQPGVVIKIPAPVAMDAYLQWMKNLTQMVLIAIIIASGGLVANERKSGTAVLVLTKPISRAGFVIAKATSEILLVTVSTLVGAGVCLAFTRVIFGEAPFVRFAEATALWLLFAVMVVALMALLSVVLNSQAGAAGVGLLVYLVLSILGAWGPARDFSPAGMLSASGRVLAGESVGLWWPVATTVLATLLAVAAAVEVFRRQEL